MTNLCISSSLGDFLVADDDDELQDHPPEINLINANKEADRTWQPKLIKRSQLSSQNIQYYTQTIFVYGLYAPFHLAHMLTNGLIPLYQTIRSYESSKRFWTYRAANFDASPDIRALIDTDFITSNPDIVQNSWEVIKDQQMERPDMPICFSRAVVGAGTACSLGYCEQPVRSETYQAFRQEALAYYDDNWIQTTARSIKHDLNCVEHATEETIGHSQNPVVIGIINRKSRKITNIKEVVETLRSIAQEDTRKETSYVIRQINFDDGCSLPSTARVVKDLDILLTPHGSQEAAAVFMKDNSVVISIDSRGYWEPWFQWPMTAMGRRFYNFQCDSVDCVENDLTLAQKYLERENLNDFTTEQIANYTSWKYSTPLEWLEQQLGDIPNARDIAELVTLEYLKNSPRKVDMKRFGAFIKDIIDDLPKFYNMSYRDVCDQGKCCGFACQGVLSANVYGSRFNGRMKAWPEAIATPGPDWHEPHS